MCIAILKKQGSEISKQTLENCFDSNPDGSGFMFSDNEKLFIHKGFMDFNSFYKSYSKIDSKNKTMLIHFRIKTHGSISKENCHPFLVSDYLGFIHNGVIDIKTKGTESDTMSFNRNYLKKIKSLHKLIKSNGIKKLIADRIENSKLVFLDKFGKFTIINENMGHWNKGSWFSNNSYKTAKFSCDYTSYYNNGYYDAYDYDEYDDLQNITCNQCENYLFEDEEYESELCQECLKLDQSIMSKIKNNTLRFY